MVTKSPKSMFGFLVAALFLALPVSAHENLPSAGITPDSSLYGLDLALEKLQLALAGNDVAKAKFELELAQERLSEISLMVEQKKFDAADKAKEKHREKLESVKSKVLALKADNSEEELDAEVELENELEKQEDSITEVSQDLDVKVRGQLTPEQQEKLDALIVSLSENSNKVKIEIKNKKDATKVRIKAEKNKNETEVDKLEEKIREKKGISAEKKERATNAMADSKEAIEDAEKVIKNFEDDGNVAPEAVKNLIVEAQDKLSNAESALAENKSGEAFGQATAAKNLAKNAKRQLAEHKVADKDVENKTEKSENKSTENKGEEMKENKSKSESSGASGAAVSKVGALCEKDEECGTNEHCVYSVCEKA